MAISITGSGHNSTITLYGIHHGNGSFRKDTATTHSQVKSMQQALTTVGYDTKGADGKFGDNTLAAVKALQKAKGLTVDGYFGQKSLQAPKLLMVVISMMTVKTVLQAVLQLNPLVMIKSLMIPAKRIRP